MASWRNSRNRLWLTAANPKEIKVAMEGLWIKHFSILKRAFLWKMIISTLLVKELVDSSNPLSRIVGFRTLSLILRVR